MVRKLKFEKKKIKFAINFSLYMEKVKNIYKKNKIMKKNIVDDSKMYFDCMNEIQNEIDSILISVYMMKQWVLFRYLAAF